MTALTKEQFERFRQQLALPGMSAAAQARLLAGHVVIVGIKSWGASVAKYLADVGIGRLTIADESSRNLAELNMSMIEYLKKNPDLRMELKQWDFKPSEAEQLFGPADLIVDGLENWQHKLIASDFCMHMKKPLVHAGGSGFRFQVYTMIPGKSACLRCAFPEVGMDDVPLTDTDTTSLSPIASMIGALEALEAIKVIGKVGASQGNEMWKFDWLSGEFETVRGLNPHYDCPDCGRYLK
ncbi:MAG TPA: HesA/MoeB/ThiF family protein [Planktothrix sp.]|jgi:adenylyltransferase/sulfurtransferase